MTVSKGAGGKVFRDRKCDRLIEVRNFAQSGVASGTNLTFDFRELTDQFSAYQKQGYVPIVRSVLVTIKQSVTLGANALLDKDYTAGMLERRVLDTWNINFPGLSEIFAPNDLPFNRCSWLNFAAMNIINPQTVRDTLRQPLPGGLCATGPFPTYAVSDSLFSALMPNGTANPDVSPLNGFWGMDIGQRVIASVAGTTEPGAGDVPADWFVIPLTRAGSFRDGDGMPLSALIQSNNSMKLLFTPRNNTALYDQNVAPTFGTFDIRVFVLIRELRSASFGKDKVSQGVPYYCQLVQSGGTNGVGILDLNNDFKVYAMGWGPQVDATLANPLGGTAADTTVNFAPPSFANYFADSARLQWYEQDPNGAAVIRTFPYKEDDVRTYQEVQLWNDAGRAPFNIADLRFRSEIKAPLAGWTETRIHETAANSLTWTALNRQNLGDVTRWRSFVSGCPFLPMAFISPQTSFPGGPRHEGSITCNPRIEYSFASAPTYSGPNATTYQNNFVLIRDKAEYQAKIAEMGGSCSPCGGGPSVATPEVDNAGSPKADLVKDMVGTELKGPVASSDAK